MAKLLISVAAAGFFLLLISTISLVVLNWSERTLTPVVSIIVVGTATILATVVVSLKATRIESAFTTSVIIDTSTGRPPLIITGQRNRKLTTRLSELFRLGLPADTVDGTTVPIVREPMAVSDQFRFCGELLQYQILVTLKKFQRGSWSVGQQFGSSFSTISVPMKLADGKNYPGEAFLSVIAGNRFADNDVERFQWRHTTFPLPKSTVVSLIHVDTGPGEFIVRFEKPLFFRIEFAASPLGSTGLGILPGGLDLGATLTAKCETYQFHIAMRATFDQITAGSSQTQEYREWANWLFTNLNDALSDQSDN